jgi:MFS family permease
VPDVPPVQLRMLGLVALALFFEQYDFSMLGAAWPRIRQDLGIPEAQWGFALSAIRAGALPAFAIVAFADRIGRRRLFLGSVLAISLATLLTAFARNVYEFVALQMVARSFMIAGMSVAFVIVTEEFPAEHRGWGVGMLGALGACGVGLGTGLFAAVDVLPFGWRALYAVGVLPLVLLPKFRRDVKETRRFADLPGGAAARGGWTGFLAPFLRIARDRPGRLALVAAIGFFSTFGVVCVFQFASTQALDVHGWKPWQFALMVFFGGGVGIIGNPVAGRLGDVVGRRVVGALSMLALPVFAAGYYLGPAWALPVAWSGLVFANSATSTIARVFATELFPTQDRGTASGLNAFFEAVGATLGLAVLGFGTQTPGNLPLVTTLLAVTVALGGGLMLLLPETRQRELEAISGA